MSRAPTVVLPDMPHIEEVRSRLWTGRELGQAAVMVGAGASRQATARSAGVPPFPLWRDLGDRLRTGLYGIGTRTVSDESVPRLAEEYESALGRPALDRLLLTAILDEDYSPSKIHELILTLPWSDIFTTNYDTLLERTRPRVHHRRYEPVNTPADLPGRMKPRIVKLHGSFPSHRPFIITEENYRRYPRESAPFVNMVQQSLMENVFCLIGFSADDPNFFYWSGWVRDNLGKEAPPIYLCGLLNLLPSRRQLLAARGVIPIDLSPLFPPTRFPDSHLRHSLALEWFLLTLLAGAPRNPLTWPRISRPRRPPASPGVPPIPEPV